MNKDHKSLGIEKIPKLLFKQGMPAMIGLIVMSLYNIVDTIFIGHAVGPLGIAGLTIAFPIHMTSMAIAMTIGIGAASIISRMLGAKKYKVAEKTLGNFFSLTIILGILITILGLYYIIPLLKLFGATNTIMPFAIDYTRIIMFSTIFIMFAVGSNNIIRSEGNARFAMIVMIISAVINVVLDPIFIFVFDMGMKGAAYATVLSQIISALAALYYFIRGKSGVYFHFENLKLKWNIVKETIAIGSSSLARHSVTALMVIILNHSLAYYAGDLAIAGFGIIFKLMGLTIMPVIGVIQGLQPIAGYNYGAKNYARTKEAVVLAIKVSTIISTAAGVVLILFAKPLTMIFTNDLELISLTVTALKIISLMFPIVGFQIVAGGFYQALGKATYAFILSILRQVLFLIPLMLIVPIFYGFEGLMFAFPISDFLAGIVTFFILRKGIRKLG